ncbi:putative holin-like toxin [Eisenbergiella sp. OF01-20]
MAMVTYDELFQFGLLIVAVVGLVYKISHKK